MSRYYIIDIETGFISRTDDRKKAEDFAPQPCYVVIDTLSNTELVGANATLKVENMDD